MSVYLLVEGHLDCVVLHNAAMNVRVRVFVWTFVSSSHGGVLKCLRNWKTLQDDRTLLLSHHQCMSVQFCPLLANTCYYLSQNHS